ncbi:hypothetical protein [Mucilaginibacter lappiensis]|uniref:Uncharacterized protein n=1 Tax=Mucilaginibacter lappiensis TaxID=354630 RepID=A0A1N6UK40_9SPHI|nr:hypothetical protein [Mucilaginibacter lappiensis]MBB6108874.1 hypothetical protein [Mucilaginibacter lappiensis]MBB6130467.1 hypothetical protein [Mucilaginibacter lappiensis]SIQ65983.1 hypothetical protein SAMN05421821_103108 [Mucilaginibacter lappiensis]
MKITAFVKTIYKFLPGICLLLITSNCFAQSNPGGGFCDGSDGGPDGCPLDTWVIILVVAAAVFAAVHLYRQKKSLQA